MSHQSTSAAPQGNRSTRFSVLSDLDEDSTGLVEFEVLKEQIQQVAHPAHKHKQKVMASQLAGASKRGPKSAPPKAQGSASGSKQVGCPTNPTHPLAKTSGPPPQPVNPLPLVPTRPSTITSCSTTPPSISFALSIDQNCNGPLGRLLDPGSSAPPVITAIPSSHMEVEQVPSSVRAACPDRSSLEASASPS